MFFFIRRMRYRLIKNRHYFLLALILPIISLSVMVYTIELSFLSTGDVPIAEPGSPTDSMLISELMASPSNIGQFIQGNCFPQLITGHPLGSNPTVSQNKSDVIHHEATTNLTILRAPDDRLLIRYTGPYRDLGQTLVAYYGETLFKRIQEGHTRRNITVPLQFKGNSPEMTTTLKSKRRLWDTRRIPKALWLFATGVIFILIFHIIRELVNTSYKSQKQIAEHTRVPILGSLPNLETATTRISHTLEM